MTNVMPGEAVQHAQVDEATIGKLFGEQDNVPYFNQIMEIPGTAYLPELTAVYLIRPGYNNGSPPPEHIGTDHPLAEKIRTLDVNTVEDPEQKHAFTLLQNSLKMRDGGSGVQWIDENTTAAMLLPSIIRGHSAKANVHIAGALKDYGIRSQDKSAPIQTAIFEATLAEVGASIAYQPSEGFSDSYDRVKLATVAAEAGEVFAKCIVDSGTAVDIREVEQLISGLKALIPHLLVSELNLNERAAQLADKLIAIDPRKALDDVTDFRATLSMALDEQVNNAIDAMLGDTGLSVAYSASIGRSDSVGAFQQLTQLFAEPSTAKMIERLEKSSTVLGSFVEKFNGKASVSEVVSQVTSSWNTPAVQKVLSKLDEPNSIEFMRQIVTHPDAVGMLLDVISGHSKLQRMVQEPSAALVPFIERMCINGIAPEFVAKAGASTISENYAQASKVADPVALAHYTNRVEHFMHDVAISYAVPAVSERYKSILEKSGGLSAKQELRAARVFKLMCVMKDTEVQGETVDEIEANLVRGFIAKLSGQETAVTDDQRTRLVEAFGTIAPLFTYASRFINDEAYRAPLSELVSSVMSGAYSVWHRGDGSPEALISLVDAGYLPTNTTHAQYSEWIKDGKSSSLEQLVSSSEDTAAAVRKTVALGSIDIDFLAPGYTIDASGMPGIVEDRNTLGMLLGLVNKLRGAAGEQAGTLNPGQVEDIAAVLGENAHRPGIANVLNMLQAGVRLEDATKAIGTMRGQLDQVRLLTRIANLSAEEVAAGALLAEPDSKGERKVQQKLADVLGGLNKDLPEELRFIPESVMGLLSDHATQQGEVEEFTVEDTIDPKVTLEIGETPSRSCQHYETGGFNQGLIGYFGPEVKIFIVRNKSGSIIARSIVRLMEDDNGEPAMYTEPIYSAVASSQVNAMLTDHAAKKAAEMGVGIRGSLGGGRGAGYLRVRKLKMPATYSDSASGINSGSLTVSSYA